MEREDASKKRHPDPGQSGLFESLDRLNQRQQEDYDG